MVRCSFSKAKLASAFVADRISLSLSSRGYATRATQGVGPMSAKRAEAKKGGDKEAKKNPTWVPDPKTGCYRPESHTNHINVAELREALLNNKIAQH